MGIPDFVVPEAGPVLRAARQAAERKLEPDGKGEFFGPFPRTERGTENRLAEVARAVESQRVAIDALKGYIWGNGSGLLREEISETEARIRGAEGDLRAMVASGEAASGRATKRCELAGHKSCLANLGKELEMLSRYEAAFERPDGTRIASNDEIGRVLESEEAALKEMLDYSERLERHLSEKRRILGHARK